MVEAWFLRTELEFIHYIDSWNIRASRSLTAPVLAVVKCGQSVQAVAVDDDWLQLAGDGGWCFRKCNSDEAFVRAASIRRKDFGLPPDSEPPSPPRLRRTLSSEERGQLLLETLRERRHALAAIAVAPGDAEAARACVHASVAVECTLAQLELLGIGPDEVSVVDGLDEADTPQAMMEAVVVELKRTKTMAHAEFANPHADSCWLSTLFQGLWHSCVFHAAFEKLIRPLPRAAAGSALGALQETWDMYEEAAGPGPPRASAWGHAGVSAEALVEAWGAGYGDCAEALGKLQSEEELSLLADWIALVPVAYEGTLVDVQDLSHAAENMGLDAKPLIAFDLILPDLPRSSINTLVRGFGGPVDMHEAAQCAACLSGGHKLCAMICLIPNFSHYVVYCRRVSDPSKWIFFNDLPGLARGALRELDSWEALARECAHFELLPRMLLYESTSEAESAAASVDSAEVRKGCAQM